MRHIFYLELLLIPKAFCWSSRKCNCACALPAEVQLPLRVTRTCWQKLFAGKNFLKILETAQTQLRSYSEQQRAFGNSNICNWMMIRPEVQQQFRHIATMNPMLYYQWFPCNLHLKLGRQFSSCGPSCSWSNCYCPSLRGFNIYVALNYFKGLISFSFNILQIRNWNQLTFPFS